MNYIRALISIWAAIHCPLKIIITNWFNKSQITKRTNPTSTITKWVKRIHRFKSKICSLLRFRSINSETQVLFQGYGGYVTAPGPTASIRPLRLPWCIIILYARSDVTEASYSGAPQHNTHILVAIKMLSRRDGKGSAVKYFLHQVVKRINANEQCGHILDMSYVMIIHKWQVFFIISNIFWDYTYIHEFR